MSAKFLKGKPVAEAVLKEVAARTEVLSEQGIVLGLGTILVGGDSASADYVHKKHETCRQVGIVSYREELPDSATQEAFLDAVTRFNQNPDIDAFLIQYPVPQSFDFNEALNLMEPAKDADGLHPVNRQDEN